MKVEEKNPMEMSFASFRKMCEVFYPGKFSAEVSSINWWSQATAIGNVDKKLFDIYKYNRNVWDREARSQNGKVRFVDGVSVSIPMEPTPIPGNFQEYRFGPLDERLSTAAESVGLKFSAGWGVWVGPKELQSEYNKLASFTIVPTHGNTTILPENFEVLPGGVVGIVNVSPVNARKIYASFKILNQRRISAANKREVKPGKFPAWYRNL